MVVGLYEMDKSVIDEAWHQIDSVNQRVDLEVGDEDDGAGVGRPTLNVPRCPGPALGAAADEGLLPGQRNAIKELQDLID